MQVPIRSGPTVERASIAPVGFTAQSDQNVLKQQDQMNSSIQNFSQTIGRIQDEARNQADQLVVLEKRKEFEKVKDQELFSPQGALMAQGKNAFEASQKANENLSLAGKNLIDSLQSDNQKLLFNHYLSEQQIDIGHRLTTHTAKEIQSYDNELTKSSIEGLRNRALTDFSDPNKIAANLAEQEILIRQMGQRVGLSDEAISNEVLNQRSNTHIGILSKMAANEMDIGATKYFNAVKDSMTENDQIKATRMLQESSYRGQSQRFVDAILQKGGSLEEGLKQAQQIQEPRLREETENRLYRVINMRKQADDLRQEKIQMSALNLIDQGKGIDSIPVDQWSSLDDNRRKGIMGYIAAKARGEDKRTDWETYYDLKEMAASSPDTFQKINVLDYQNKLSNADLKGIIDLQTQIKSGKKNALDGFLTDKDIVKGAMESAGIKDKKAQAEFMAVIDSEKVRNPRMNNDDLRKVVNEKLTKVITDKGFIFDSTKFQYQLDGATDEIQGVKYNTIPREDKSRISDLLKSKGMPVTERSIEMLYTQGLKMRMGK